MGSSHGSMKFVQNVKYEFTDLGRIIEDRDKQQCISQKNAIISRFGHEQLVQGFSCDSSVLSEAYWLSLRPDKFYIEYPDMKVLTIKALYKAGEQESQEVKDFICHILRETNCI